MGLGTLGREAGSKADARGQNSQSDVLDTTCRDNVWSDLGLVSLSRGPPLVQHPEAGNARRERVVSSDIARKHNELLWLLDSQVLVQILRTRNRVWFNLPRLKPERVSGLV